MRLLQWGGVVEDEDVEFTRWDGVDLWLKIQTEGRFLVTTDKGFADIRLYSPGTHFGIMLLRPDQDGIRPIVELIERVLQSYDLNSLAGTQSQWSRRAVYLFIKAFDLIGIRIGLAGRRSQI